jgi:hypothetical protein
LADRIQQDEFTLVTNNGPGFLQLLGKMDLHPGLIILVPNVGPALQRALFQAALRHTAQRDLVNTVIEVSLEGNTVTCLEYRLPGERRATAYRKPRPLTR